MKLSKLKLKIHFIGYLLQSIKPKGSSTSHNSFITKVPQS